MLHMDRWCCLEGLTIRLRPVSAGSTEFGCEFRFRDSEKTGVLEAEESHDPTQPRSSSDAQLYGPDVWMDRYCRAHVSRGASTARTNAGG